MTHPQIIAYRIGRHIFSSKRFSGGGGRSPGGGPAFSWKQKKILGLDKSQLKPFKIRPDLAPWDDIKMYFDESRGDKIIDLTDLETFEEPPFEEEKEINSRKVIQVNRLFGSNKPSGTLPGLIRKPFRGHKIDKRVYPKMSRSMDS